MKAWYKSKTLWVNALAALLIAAEANLGLLKPYLSDAQHLLLLLALPAVNAALRIVTTTGIGANEA
ncbi:MAG: hypothetical protein ACRCWC_04220 [Plesiomonas shigelloides]